ncbi:SIS domain-containing protein [Pelagibius sp. Alg239-R121]|uniref:KpsF/GutQ family sugar-phosphate isomerase n=1 Tax=Pelagibius sp. Alg239-R121 TaxID=2993448 RepID=UPI0024A6F14A|nr:KpsF/GutQ family sugar-phosphate isomerase [Pelagibius sp. Alg239-R121]
MKPLATSPAAVADLQDSAPSTPSAGADVSEAGDPGPAAVDTRQGLEFGRRVLQREIHGLQDLAEGLDESFVQALDILAALKGRAIITGMGKSGHVARKIAATLASTGTPSQFVHPGEASHGDLGMIARDDVVLALSNSGNTTELTDIVGYTRRYAIPLIAMTSRARSTLAEAADVALILPRAPEACSITEAPTTSTTMALALGDALAVSLLECKGFSAQDFHVFHPGGALGSKLVRVSEVMRGRDELPLCDPETAVSDAILLMTGGGFGCVGVTDGSENLIGIVTDGDLRRNMAPSLLQCRVRDVMTPEPKSIRPQALAAEALGVMNDNKITSLFVLEDDRPVGIVRMHDCLHIGVA